MERLLGWSLSKTYFVPEAMWDPEELFRRPRNRYSHDLIYHCNEDQWALAEANPTANDRDTGA
jgi:hypothetical protein